VSLFDKQIRLLYLFLHRLSNSEDHSFAVNIFMNVWFTRHRSGINLYFQTKVNVILLKLFRILVIVLNKSMKLIGLTKWYWDRFISKLFRFPFQYHSTGALHAHISPGVNRGPGGGCSSETVLPHLHEQKQQQQGTYFVLYSHWNSTWPPCTYS
jgi:hypothetical protein